MSAVVAGAALVASGCGGVLGSSISDALKVSVPLGCAIEHANRENDVYSAAVDTAFGGSGQKFRGLKSDDLTVDANRRRIYAARLAELNRTAKDIGSDKDTQSDEERQILAALRADLAADRILMRYDMRWAPGDQKAPLSTEIATNVSDLLVGASSGIKKAFGNCPVIPATERRAFEYGVS